MVFTVFTTIGLPCGFSAGIWSGCCTLHRVLRTGQEEEHRSDEQRSGSGSQAGVQEVAGVQIPLIKSSDVLSTERWKLRVKTVSDHNGSTSQWQEVSVKTPHQN